MLSPSLDVAVIGGGVSGIYAAWRLRRESGLSVGLFERSGRLGGRLYSRTLKGMPHLVAELGGMRYIPESHLYVTHLVEHLGLRARPFTPDDRPVNAPENYVYLRHHHLRMSELGDPDKVPYFLRWTERGKTPAELMDHVLETYIQNREVLSDEHYPYQQVLGKPLYQWGLWNLYDQVLSNEAYNFLRFGGGYDTDVANSNAVSAFYDASLVAPSVTYRGFVDGFQSLPLGLAEELGEDAITRHRRLVRIEPLPSAERRYRLVFQCTQEQYEGEVSDHPTDGTHEILADHIILAMPRRGLELIEADFFFDDRTGDAFLHENLSSVTGQASFKLFLGYPQPWWRGLGIQSGRSLTDLPLRQTFYFGTEGEQDGADRANRNSLMMASYSDIDTVPFWKGLEKGPSFSGGSNPFIAESEDAMHAEDRRTITAEMVRVAHKQILEIHNLEDLPLPYTAAYKNWSEDPYGGGWYAWKAGYEYWKIQERMCRLRADEQIYICGDCYSSEQGWVEGALETAERLLTGNFGLEPLMPASSEFPVEALKLSGTEIRDLLAQHTDTVEVRIPADGDSYLKAVHIPAQVDKLTEETFKASVGMERDADQDDPTLGLLQGFVSFEAADETFKKLSERNEDVQTEVEQLVQLMQTHLRDLKLIVVGGWGESVIHPYYLLGVAPDGSLVGLRTVVVWS